MSSVIDPKAPGGHMPSAIPVGRGTTFAFAEGYLGQRLRQILLEVLHVLNADA